MPFLFGLTLSGGFFFSIVFIMTDVIEKFTVKKWQELCFSWCDKYFFIFVLLFYFNGSAWAKEVYGRKMDII